MKEQQFREKNLKNVQHAQRVKNAGLTLHQKTKESKLTTTRQGKQTAANKTHKHQRNQHC